MRGDVCDRCPDDLRDDVWSEHGHDALRPHVRAHGATALGPGRGRACAGRTQRGGPGLVDLAPILEPVRAYHRVPALAIALVRDGEIHAIGAVGTRAVGSMRPVELDDQWHLGSCGKAFTATAAAALVEAGRIDWGTTIAEVYPEMVGRIRPAYEPVTLTQLLMHRGGYVARDARFDDAVAVTDGTIPTRRAAAVRFASSRRSIADPGTAFAYTDVGYTVAGALLERVTGSTWEALVVEHVADPLSLASLGFGAPGSEEAVDQPRGHVLVDGKLKPLGTGPGQDLANPVIGPAGTIHASMADWATFARAHLKGARGEANGLLAPTTIQRLHADLEGQGYAIGWGVSANPWGEGRALSHSGSCGAWSALIWILPEANAAIVGATNVGSAFDAVADAMDRVMRMP